MSYLTSMTDEAILVDARGHRCPMPTLKLRKALDAAPAGACVRLLADDPMARIDVPHFAGQIGATVIEQGEDGGVLSFVVRKP
jgi:tRNA 2-thiouridine synthesizing protein A